jgi:hypothetical protein
MAPYNPPIAHYSQMDVSDVTDEEMYAFIGRGGKKHYWLTRLLNLNYLWYCSKKKCLEIWGPYFVHENKQSQHVLRCELDHFLNCRRRQNGASEDAHRRAADPGIPDEKMGDENV